MYADQSASEISDKLKDQMRIKNVHFDVTDLCNAGCPQCARTDPNGCLPKSWLKQDAISLADFQNYCSEDLLREIESADFCGNFGDPAVVPEILDILKWCWDVNPNLRIKLFSNCSVHSTDWWHALGMLAKDRNFRLIAGIDGASQETNSRYRVRTNFDRIMENTAAFIEAGGQAEWRMLVFLHNENETQIAEALARDRGFAKFMAYPSNRFFGSEPISYTHKGEEHRLAPATVKLPPKPDSTHKSEGQQPQETEVVIECEALKNASAFVDFLGYLTPCCHVGRRIYMHEQGAFSDKDPWMGDIFDTFDHERLNVGRSGYSTARAALDEFLIHLNPRWQDKQPIVCRNNCGKKRLVSRSNED
ncbi:hypothetical protein RUE5091_01692 [Ruegeria denitrificans]|uniref:Molybdenum cofactor biosynthesis protein A n=1 Tax=Ruegeria denitrificans TaxID=1715692 RepID=A0A0P1I833_9RHOB|nr:radical SAM protein [Ruegeria denitrificans]CUJ96576.1 hypothetical protein RUE5091_01692 [Ruegeria denitrificans]